MFKNMFKSIRWKLLSVFILLIVSVLIIVGTVLLLGISSYYTSEFYKEMKERAFAPQGDIVKKLQQDLSRTDPVAAIRETMEIYFGRLGINANRNYYLLDGKNADILDSSKMASGVMVTASVLQAMSGTPAGEYDGDAGYMDYAYPLMVDNQVKYVVCIKDNKQELQGTTARIYIIMLWALLMGIVLSALLGYFFAQSFISALVKFKKAAEEITRGNFGKLIPVNSDDEIGELTRTFNIMALELSRNITQVSAEKNKMLTIINHSADGIMAFDQTGSVIHVNPAAYRMLGINRNFDVKFDEYFANNRVDVRISQFAHAGETQQHGININERFLMAYFAAFKAEAQDFSGVVVVFHDVTEEQRLDAERREFVANVSHEMRTPLTTIKSYAQTLMDDLEDDSDGLFYKFLSVIDSEADRMTRIVKDLLTLSRLDNSREIEKKPGSIVDMVRAIISKLGIDAKNHGHKLISDIKEDMPDIFMDTDRMEQVITNVLANAIKYTPNGGEISVSLYNDKGFVYVSIKDNGIGIPEEDAERVFERFYTVDKARSRKYGGTGLGLAIAKEIVEYHGGNIRMETKLGHGTKMTIVLPLE